MKKELELAQKQRREGQLENQRLREKCQQLDDRLATEQAKGTGGWGLSHTPSLPTLISFSLFSLSLLLLSPPSLSLFLLLFHSIGRAS